MARGDQVEGLEDPGWSADRYGNANLGDYTYGPQDEYIDKHEKSQRAITVRQERVDKPKPQPTHNHPQYQGHIKPQPPQIRNQPRQDTRPQNQKLDQDSATRMIKRGMPRTGVPQIGIVNPDKFKKYDSYMPSNLLPPIMRQAGAGVSGPGQGWMHGSTPFNKASNNPYGRSFSNKRHFEGMPEEQNPGFQGGNKSNNYGFESAGVEGRVTNRTRQFANPQAPLNHGLAVRKLAKNSNLQEREHVSMPEMPDFEKLYEQQQQQQNPDYWQNQAKDWATKKGPEENKGSYGSY